MPERRSSSSAQARLPWGTGLPEPTRRAVLRWDRRAPPCRRHGPPRRDHAAFPPQQTRAPRPPAFPPDSGLRTRALARSIPDAPRAGMPRNLRPFRQPAVVADSGLGVNSSLRRLPMQLMSSGNSLERVKTSEVGLLAQSSGKTSAALDSPASNARRPPYATPVRHQTYSRACPLLDSPPMSPRPEGGSAPEGIGARRLRRMVPRLRRPRPRSGAGRGSPAHSLRGSRAPGSSHRRRSGGERVPAP